MRAAPEAAAPPGAVPTTTAPIATRAGAAGVGTLGGYPFSPTIVPGIQDKTVKLRFIGRGGAWDADVLEDVHIYPDQRTNSLLISAPEKTMIMLIKLIEEMDVPPAYAATVNVFTLKKADATTVANILTRMFLGTAATGAGGVPAGGVGAGAQRPSVLAPFG